MALALGWLALGRPNLPNPSCQVSFTPIDSKRPEHRGPHHQHWDRTHPAVKNLIAACNDGSAFNSSFLHYPATLSDEERERFKRHYDEALPQMKLSIRVGARYGLVYGTEFRITHSHRLRLPMKYEDDAYPSTFDFPAGAEQQAYLVLDARGQDVDTVEVHMLLWRIEDQWKPILIGTRTSNIKGTTADETFERAVAAKGSSENLRALALTRLAAAIAIPMPHRVSGLQHQIAGLESELTGELGVGERSLFSLAVDETELEIEDVRAIILSGDFFVELHSKMHSVSVGDELRASQARIANAFRARFPEFEKRFHGVAVSQISVEAATRGQGFRTVHPFGE